MSQFELCIPNSTYFIIEEIHPRDGAIGRAARITPSLMQVYRRVVQVCDAQGGYQFDGKPIEASYPTNWQILRHLVSGRERITSNPTGEQMLILVYAGFKNIVTPLPKVRDLLPEEWTKAYDWGVPRSPFIYGVDPLPAIELYRNPSIHFIMPGGNPPPSAFAIYNKDSMQLDEIREPSERDRVLQSVVQSQR